MVLIVDHYDSFTYNLYQLFLEEVEDVRVFRSDKISVDEIEKMDPDHIVLSPGPGKPEEAGRFMEIVRNFKEKKPLLGICLGHKAIMAEAGVPIIKAK
ncbi:MAG: glutamine amidotransferase-related protein, partial [Thermotogota bacterium]